MSDFTPAYAAINLDPYKRVHYAPGLVLGVEDFVQEELYLLSKGRLHNRALHGYGTVCGLSVETRVGDGGEPEILVRAGIALDPLGREIRVPQDQCAGINRWLAANATALSGSPLPAPLPLYLVLCYRECTTDDVPVPGGPCRSLEDSRVPSRIADDFELALRTDAPAQIEEDAVRAFGDLLRAIEISDAPGDFLTGDELNDLVRGLGGGSPDGPPALGSPALYRLHPDDAADLLQAAFRVWATEVRPSLLPEGRNCASGPPPETCVLLASINLTLEEVAGVPRLRDDDVANAVLEEGRRPYLLHTRLLQEWLRNKSDATLGAAGGDLDGSYPDPTVVGLQGNPVAPAPSPLVEGQLLTWGGSAWDAQTLSFGGDLAGDAPDPIVVGLQGDPIAPAPSPLVAGQVLTWSGSAWQARDLPASGVTSHGDLTDLEEDDHDAYLPRNGDRPMTGTLDMDGHDIDMGTTAGNPARITNLSPGNAPGNAVEHDQAVKVGDPVPLGDLTGAYPSPTIARLQTRTLNANPTADGQVLTWDATASQWVARAVPTAGGGSNQQPNLVRIHALSWVHGAPTAADILFDGARTVGFVVQFGRRDPGDARVQVRPGSLDTATFQVFVRAPFLQPGTTTLTPFPGTYQWVGLEAEERRIFPVDGVVDATGATDVSTVSSPNAPAAAFLLDRNAMVLLRNLRNLDLPLELRIQIHGDFVLDELGEQAVDAEHLRARLPSGDRPDGSPRGIQGGLFESWCRFSGLDG